MVFYINICGLFLDIIRSLLTLFGIEHARRFDNMLRKVSAIVLICVEIVFLNFDEVICKSGGGHYSSQRLGGGSSGSYGGSGGNQPVAWGNSWSMQDMNSWYDYGEYRERNSN